eukprot:8357979-Lingulodinium_polyedra.AAC.1
MIRLSFKRLSRIVFVKNNEIVKEEGRGGNRVAREELLRTCPRGTDALVVFYCKSGAHRSVACARFFAAVAARYASEVQVVHYSESYYWRARYCGPCAHCLGDEAAKAAVVDAAVNMWFAQPP